MRVEIVGFWRAAWAGPVAERGCGRGETEEVAGAGVVEVVDLLLIEVLEEGSEDGGGGVGDSDGASVGCSEGMAR